MSERIIYTVQEVAKMLHSSPNYIYLLIEKGYLPAMKLGIKIYFRKILTRERRKRPF